MEILAVGNRIRVVNNGVQIVDWVDPEPHRIKSGPIGLQLHSNSVPQELHFKDIEIESFPQDVDGARRTVARNKLLCACRVSRERSHSITG
jgi:hypothetical protein